MAHDTNGLILGIDITTYQVKDVPRAKAFYRDVMGMPLTSEYGEPGRGNSSFPTTRRSGCGRWTMVRGRKGTAQSFRFANFDDALAKFKQAGVKIEPHTEDTPVCKMAFGEDSEAIRSSSTSAKNGRDWTSHSSAGSPSGGWGVSPSV